MLIGVGATILQFLAILTSFVSIMESIKRTMANLVHYILVDFFNETISSQKVYGIVLLSFGIFFILNY